MQFPSLIAQTKVIETTDDQGVVQQTRQNTVLEMLLSSTVQGADWQKMAEDLATTLARQSPAGLPPAQPLDMTPPGSPPTPTGGGNTIEELQAAMTAAYNAGEFIEVSRLTKAMAEARMRQE
jgi:hypothetical protein